MNVAPLQNEQIAPVAQVLLAFLEHEDVAVPAAMVEGIVSGKSLLRGILQGQLVVCQVQPDADNGPEVPPKATTKKKTTRKKKPAKAA